MLDPRVVAFVSDRLLPAYQSLSSSPRIQREFSAHVYRDAIDDPVHAALIAELHVDHVLGPVLLLEHLDAAQRPAPFGGRYVVAPAMREAGDVLVSPVVMYQMQFDRELHVFRQRYASLSEIPIDKVTRTMIVNHVLHSFAFFRTHAGSPVRPW